MKFISTRLSAPHLNFEQVILQGLGNDGGLYIPEFLPNFSQAELAKMRKMNYQELFFEITRHFVEGEIDDQTYKNIIEKSYRNFHHLAIAPIKQLDSNHFLLELFHGPTLAFKDFALQFLGNLLDYFLKKSGQKIVIVGATSGDTGSAAIYGCSACQNAEIFIMHPHKKVSDFQRKQMTSFFATNVFNIALQGNFDDCQNLVKKMFANQEFLKGKQLVAVNSINFARIMAQIVYYFYSALRLGGDKNQVSFCVPSGNFGDAYAGFLAKKMGLLINKIVVATNSNDILVRFFNKNNYRREEMIETLSPSMNIQVASNFERLLFDLHKKFECEEKMPELMKNFERTGHLEIDFALHQDATQDFCAFSIDDSGTKMAINEFFQETGEILDPHTAIGAIASEKFIKSSNYHGEPVITLATAHPAKFDEAIKAAINIKPNIPDFLADLFDREERFEILENNLDVVKNFISSRIN